MLVQAEGLEVSGRGSPRGGVALLCSLLLCHVLGLSFAAACSRDERQPEVVLYTSTDNEIARLAASAFENETGIRVRVAGDTEQTKTTGLVQRLLAEKDAPRADVWWSSEALGTVKLARSGVLEPYTSAAAEARFAEGWPEHLRAKDGTWYGFGMRARVYVYNTRHVAEADAPARLADLLDPRAAGRVGIARPAFGTTATHIAAVMQVFGEEGLRVWARGLKANGVRVYEGNAAVVRAVASGEVHVGLTDTDDVWNAQRNGLPVAARFEPDEVDPKASYPPAPEGLRVGMGPLMIPNTVAIVRGARNPDAARRLADFLLSERFERMLAESDSRNIPLSPALAAEYARFAPPPVGPADGPGPFRRMDVEGLAEVAERALAVWGEELGR